MTTYPRSAYDNTSGMLYFARMLDKIRLHAAGKLHPDFIDNLGESFDGRCCKFLRIAYPDLVRRVSEGGSNEEILAWCYANGRQLDENDVWIWNEFLRKVGWNDPVSERLAERKAQSGLADRADIQTMFDYFEFDEGRR